MGRTARRIRRWRLQAASTGLATRKERPPVQQADAHGDGPDVQVPLVDHILGGQDVLLIQHGNSSDPVHGLEDVLPLDADGFLQSIANRYSSHSDHLVAQILAGIDQIGVSDPVCALQMRYCCT